MNYQEMKANHSKRVNAFPMRFAFTNNGLKEILTEWQIDREELLSIGSGGFIRRKDADAFGELFDSISGELEKAMQDDIFLIDALEYELGNHEFVITCDETEALAAVGLALDELTEREKNCLLKAKKRYLKYAEA